MAWHFMWIICLVEIVALSDLIFIQIYVMLQMHNVQHKTFIPNVISNVPDRSVHPYSLNCDLSVSI